MDNGGGSRVRFGLLMALIMMNVSAVGLLLFSQSVPPPPKKKSHVAGEAAAENDSFKHSITSPPQKQTIIVSYRPNTNTKDNTPHAKDSVRTRTESMSDSSFHRAGYDWSEQLVGNLENNFVNSLPDRTSAIISNFNSQIVPTIEKLNNTVAQVVRLERHLDQNPSNMISSLNGAVCPTVNKMNEIVTSISQKWEGKNAFCPYRWLSHSPNTHDYVSILSHEECAFRRRRAALVVATGKRWITRQRKSEHKRNKKRKKKLVTKVVQTDPEIPCPAAFPDSSPLLVATTDCASSMVSEPLDWSKEFIEDQQGVEFQNIPTVPSTLLSHSRIERNAQVLTNLNRFLVPTSPVNFAYLKTLPALPAEEIILPACPGVSKNLECLKELSSLNVCDIPRGSSAILGITASSKHSLNDYDEALRLRSDGPEINVIASLCMLILKVFETWSDTNLSQPSNTLNGISSTSSKFLISTKETQPSDGSAPSALESLEIRGHLQSNYYVSPCTSVLDCPVNQKYQRREAVEKETIQNDMDYSSLPNQFQSLIAFFTPKHLLLTYPIVSFEMFNRNVELTELTPSNCSNILPAANEANCQTKAEKIFRESSLKCGNEFFGDTISEQQCESLEASSADTFYSGLSSDQVFFDCSPKKESSRGVGRIDQVLDHLSKIQEVLAESHENSIPNLSKVDCVTPPEELTKVVPVKVLLGEEEIEYINSVSALESEESSDLWSASLSTAIHSEEDSSFSVDGVSTDESSSQSVKVHHKMRKFGKTIFKKFMMKKRNKYQDPSELNLTDESKSQLKKRKLSSLLTSRQKK